MEQRNAIQLHCLSRPLLLHWRAVSRKAPIDSPIEAMRFRGRLDGRLLNTPSEGIVRRSECDQTASYRGIGVALSPTASTITVSEVVEKFDSDFASVAKAVENGEFAFWVGSGISGQAPSLGDLIERAFDYIRQRACDPVLKDRFLPAFEEILGLAELDPAPLAGQFKLPIADWPERKAIRDRLWNKYSRVLDVRIQGTPSDFILWDAVDIRDAFQHPKPPGPEHLCIAVLLLEGAVKEIASANWDGFIEVAVERLSGGTPGVLQVVVDPNQLRGPAGRARLLKFHGCIVHASHEPLVFRRFLTGSHTQITGWPQNASFAAMQNTITDLATTHKTLVLGLSIQDNNLQTIFNKATAIHPWPWPPNPSAPAYVFCEDAIREGQRDVLKQGYGDAYNDNITAVHDATLLRAWAAKVLVGLVLQLLSDKLSKLMELELASVGKPLIASDLTPLLKAMRDSVASLAVPVPGRHDLSDFVNEALVLWSRMLSLFRRGTLPQNGDAYETLTSSTPNLIAADQNAQAMALGKLGIALSLLQDGWTAGRWELLKPASDDLGAGALTARSTRPGATNRQVFIVKSASEAIQLQSAGAFGSGEAIVLHGDNSWHKMVSGPASPRRVRSPPGRTGTIGDTHISLAELVTNCADATTLKAAFASEMML